MTSRLLLVDDDRFTRSLFQGLFSEQDIAVEAVANLAEARERLSRTDFNLVCVDQRLPDGSGLDFLVDLVRRRPRQVAMLITAYAEVRDAVRAVREGVFDYMAKPFASLEELETVIRKALELDNAYRESDGLRRLLAARQPTGGFIGRSTVVQDLLDRVRRVAPLDTTVVLEGESGTGKELVAQLIHELSHGERGRFVAVNCGALAEPLLESALFGYERGAFTGAIRATPGFFEEANNGTLFLDEIADMSPKLQNSLLRVLQERRYNRLGATAERSTRFRLIAASNRSLAAEVDAGRFRTDLFYRINVVALRLPALRERREDIVPLALHFFELFTAKFGRRLEPPSAAALRWLEGRPWPGNVRELRHTIERAVALKATGPIEVEDLLPPDVAPDGGPADLPFEAARARFEAEYLRDAMARANGNISEAARRIGIARQNLHLKLRRLGIVTPP